MLPAMVQLHILGPLPKHLGLPFVLKRRLHVNFGSLFSKSSQNDHKRNVMYREQPQLPAYERKVQQPMMTYISASNEEKLPKKWSHLKLYKSQRKSVGADREQKPLVILFQWLYAKPPAVAKYCDLYHEIGMDVLTVQGKLKHFLWPQEGVKLSAELFDYLKANRPQDEKLFVHAFSIGAYNYTIAMQKAHGNPEKSGHFRDRITGQIFDSVVLGTLDNMSRGIAEVLPNNNLVKRMVLLVLDTYFQLAKKTTNIYDGLVLHFKKEPIVVPTLIFSSLDDPMCDPVAMEEMLGKWRLEQPDFEVTAITWPKSKHAAHLKEHPEEYKAAWTAIMNRLRLLRPVQSK